MESGAAGGARVNPIRALPVSPRATYDQVHHECQLEQARRAERLALLITEHEDQLADLTRDYETLADRYNATRAELARCHAWFAGHPLHHREEPS